MVVSGNAKPEMADQQQIEESDSGKQNKIRGKKSNGERDIRSFWKFGRGYDLYTKSVAEVQKTGPVVVQKKLAKAEKEEEEDNIVTPIAADAAPAANTPVAAKEEGVREDITERVQKEESEEGNVAKQEEDKKVETPVDELKPDPPSSEDLAEKEQTEEAQKPAESDNKVEENAEAKEEKTEDAPVKEERSNDEPTVEMKDVELIGAEAPKTNEAHADVDQSDDNVVEEGAQQQTTQMLADQKRAQEEKVESTMASKNPIAACLCW